MGGAPVRVDGKLQLLEGPRFPASFDQELVPVFNTNTALVDIDALDRRTTTSRGCTYARRWTAARPFSSSGSTTRSRPSYRRSTSSSRAAGARGRFSPIKTPADLERAQDDLRELVSASPI